MSAGPWIISAIVKISIATNRAGITTASQHLKVLREAGLVTTRRRGTQICYSVDAAGLRMARQILEPLEPAALTSAG